MSSDENAPIPVRLHSMHWVVLLTSLFLTLFAWYFSSQQLTEKYQARFVAEAQQIVELLHERMQKYEGGLWAGVGLIQTLGPSRPLDRADWVQFADSMDLPGRYPGINGIGVIFHVHRDELGQHQMRFSPQYPELDGFRLHPPVDAEEHFPITFIEPFATNRQAVGLDMAFEENRLDGAMRAMRSGGAQITGPIVLVQDQDRTPGFLFYAPFYLDRGEARTIQNLGGMVYAPFVVRDLMAGVLAQEKRGVTFSVRDGEIALYAESADNAAGYDPYPMFATQVSLPLYGRDWVFDIQSNQAFREQATTTQPATILLAGLTVDALLLAIFLILVRSNARAQALASKMTKGLRRSERELQRRNEELIQFNYRVSHDLVAPLRTVLGLLRMVREDVSDGDLDEVPTELNKMDDLVESQLELITNIFNLCKADHTNEAPELVVLAPLAEEIFAEVMTQHAEADVKLRLDFERCPALLVEPKRLRQVLTNLISNAVKYRNEAREQPFVEVSAEPSAAGMVLRVRDNGIGIPREAQAKVFDLFFRAHSRGSEGAGLGTYIVKKHIEYMGGIVRLYSDPAGTCFEMELPERLIQQEAA